MQQPAVPKAAKQSTVPVGRRLGGDGAESGATVNVQLRGETLRVGILRGVGAGGESAHGEGLTCSSTSLHNIQTTVNIPLKRASHDVRVKIK